MVKVVERMIPHLILIWPVSEVFSRRGILRSVIKLRFTARLFLLALAGGMRVPAVALVPTFDEHAWIEAPRTAAGVRAYIREDDPTDDSPEHLLLESIAAAEDATALVRTKLGMEPSAWYWQGGVSACGERSEVDGSASLCVAVAAPSGGWLRLTYVVQANAGTPFYREERLRVWRTIFRTRPFADPVERRVQLGDPIFLICRTEKGLFQVSPTSGALTPLDPHRLYPDHYNYVFYSVADVDGQRVNVLRRTLRVRASLSP